MKGQCIRVFLTLLCIQPVSSSVFAAGRVGTDQNLAILAQSSGSIVSPISQDMPMGQSVGGHPSLLPKASSSDTVHELFGTEGGYFHPYLSIAEEYSDNLFNVNWDKKENWLTRISPGLWVSLPRRKEVPITIVPHNSSPGGLQLALHDYEGFNRYHFYLLGGLDIKLYSEDSNLNDTDGKVEGLFQFNLRSGLTLQAVDRYTHGQDRFDAGSSTANGLRRYNSNFMQGTFDWLVSEKFRTKIDYSNFLLDYTDSQDDFLDRNDNTVSAYAYYIYSPKTDLFVEYSFIDVSYDHSEGKSKDNKNNFVYAGVHWVTTEKTSLRFKAGYQKKKYDNDQSEGINNNPDGFALEGELLYKFTVKTDIDLKVSRKIDETDSYVALNKKVLAASLVYNQKITDKWIASCHIGYEHADYDQLIDQSRDDKRFVISPALQYLFRDWLMGEVRYTYDTRNSSDDFFDYDTNRVMLSLNFAI